MATPLFPYVLRSPVLNQRFSGRISPNPALVQSMATCGGRLTKHQFTLRKDMLIINNRGVYLWVDTQLRIEYL